MPAALKPGARLTVPVPSPLSVNDTKDGRPGAKSDGTVPSGSVAVTVTFKVVPSSITWSAIGWRIGA